MINRLKFFNKVRQLFGLLNQGQVDGFNVILREMDGLPLRHQAYILATVWHETGRTIQPVREGFGVSDEYRKKHFRYYPYYGRGYVQLTWKENYKKAGDFFKVDLVGNPDKAMEPTLAARILVTGMTNGWFGTKLGNQSYVEMRKAVNGTDRAEMIAAYAEKFEQALSDGQQPAPAPVKRKNLLEILIEIIKRIFT